MLDVVKKNHNLTSYCIVHSLSIYSSQKSHNNFNDVRNINYFIRVMNVCKQIKIHYTRQLSSLNWRCDSAGIGAVIYEFHFSSCLQPVELSLAVKRCQNNQWFNDSLDFQISC